MTPTVWANWWDMALSYAPHFSWLFCQDHRGGQESPQHIVAYFKALLNVLSQRGVKFWANAEFFHITADTRANGGEGNATRTQGSIDRIHRQLLEEAPHVQGFTMWEWHWYLSPTGGVQEHRASRSTAIHSNGSLTLYRNYQRTVLQPGVALLLATASHAYTIKGDQPMPGQTDTGGLLTDGAAYSQAKGCVGWRPTGQPISIALNLTTPAELNKQTFRMVSSFRAYFLRLDSMRAHQPESVTVSCKLGGDEVKLAPVTKFVADGQMVVWDASTEAIEAQLCEFTISHS